MTPRIHPLLRTPDQPAKVASVELFFDLVHVFAVTQLSHHHLLERLTPLGALQTAILWFALWLGWRYTAWVSYWLTLRRRYSGHDGPGADDGVGGVACSSPTPCNDDEARLRHSRRATSSRLAA